MYSITNDLLFTMPWDSGFCAAPAAAVRTTATTPTSTRSCRIIAAPRLSDYPIGTRSIIPHAHDDGHRYPQHQHHSHAFDGRGPAGQLRASRNADGPGAGCVHTVAAASQVRPGRSHLAGSRSLRAVGGARIDAAL